MTLCHKTGLAECDFDPKCNDKLSFISKLNIKSALCIIVSIGITLKSIHANFHHLKLDISCLTFIHTYKNVILARFAKTRKFALR